MGMHAEHTTAAPQVGSCTQQCTHVVAATHVTCMRMCSCSKWGVLQLKQHPF